MGQHRAAGAGHRSRGMAAALAYAGVILGAVACAPPGPPMEAPAPAPAPVATPPAAPIVDPPSRVGRLAYLDGQVSFRPADDSAWTAAEPNRPVTTGDRLWADASSRAEVDIGASDVRIGQETELDVVRLDDRAMQVRLPQGSVIERVRTLEPTSDAEIDAPNAAVTIAQPGEYRVAVTPDGATSTITVWSGSATVTAAGSSFQVNAHQSATVRGVETPTFDLTQANQPDTFDRWSFARDEREEQAVATPRYVSADIPGASDLDEYGRWSTDPTYGPVWYPTAVQAGWAPYHHGHWVWVGRWGWTWVDEAPWGWAPFHYGRWAYIGDSWAWCPGRVVVERPVYAPALVVFVGGSGPAVGWFPLAPEEVYRPAYAASPRYLQQVNVRNVTNITNITNVTNATNVTNVTNVTNINNVTYQNRSVPGAIVTVPTHVITNAEPVSRAAGLVQNAELTPAARVVGSAPALVPSRASLVGHPPVIGGGLGAPVAPPVALAARPVIALHAPPPTTVPFAAQEHALGATPGRPLPPAQITAIRQSLPPQHIDVLPVRPALATPAVVPTPAVGHPPTPTATSAAAPPANGQGGTTPVANQAGSVGPATPQVAKVTTPPGAAFGAPSGTPTAVRTNPKIVARPPTSPGLTAGSPARPGAGPTPGPTAIPVHARTTPAITQHSGFSTPLSNQERTTAIAAPPPPPPPPPPPAQPQRTSIDVAYQQEHVAMEARHQQEFAHSPAGESPEALSARHEAEHQQLDERYQHARPEGRPTLQEKPRR